MSGHLLALAQGDSVPVFGPYRYPFYPPMGSRSNMVMIGAGCGMVPFRWLAHKVHGRGLDWMGKVLMLEGPETGLEQLYMNEFRYTQSGCIKKFKHGAITDVKGFVGIRCLQ